MRRGRWAGGAGWGRARLSPHARGCAKMSKARSFLEYLITPGILLTLFIASGSLCF